DPNRSPEQVQARLHPWQAMRMFCTDVSAFNPNPPPRTPDLLTVDVGGFDAAFGRTYAELGLEARSMHKCQGTSQLLLLPGLSQSRTYKLQDAVTTLTGVRLPPPPGATPTAPLLVAGASLLEGIDTSIVGLMRFAGQRPEPSLRTALVALQQMVTDARAAFTSRGPAAAVAPLAAGLRATRALRTDVPRLLGIPASGPGGVVGSDIGSDVTPSLSDIRTEIDFRLAQKERQFQEALVVASATRLDALADDGVVTPGQTVNLT